MLHTQINYSVVVCFIHVIIMIYYSMLLLSDSGFTLLVF